MDQKETRSLEAIKAGLEWSKQISTLAAAVIVLSGTFLEVYGNSPSDKSWLYASWILMLVCLLFGVLYFSATVSDIQNADHELDAYARTPVFFATVHMLTFLIGLVTFVVFVWSNI
jgi:uncharacterized membrane protein